MTCHAAIVSRELGVPAVVGARNATAVLRDGELVTVDGAEGLVTEGAVAAGGRGVRAESDPGRERTGGSRHPDLREPGVRRAREEVAALPVDGVGLLRAEFMVTDALGGVHPRRLLERGEEKTFVESMAKSLVQHHPGLRATSGRVPEYRLPVQRVLEPRGGRQVRTQRGEPDDRLSRLLPLRP